VKGAGGKSSAFGGKRGRSRCRFGDEEGAVQKNYQKVKKLGLKEGLSPALKKEKWGSQQ